MLKLIECCPSRRLVPHVALLVCGQAMLAACGTDTQCLTNRDFFEQRLWVPLMSSNCATCHSPGGAAATLNSKLMLMPASYPTFLDDNLSNVSNVAHIEYNGTSELLLKPLGKMNHGGGKVMDASDPAYGDLQTFISRVSNPPSCGEATAKSALRYATLLDPAATLRRASIQINGTLPAPADTQALLALANNPNAAEARLKQDLQAMVNNPNFLARLRVIFNDVLLTDQYLPGSNAINLLNQSDYPSGLAWFNNPNTSDTDKMLANTAVAREPLELINYIVKNNLPFTQVVDAHYTVVNPWSARIYGVSPSFVNSNDPNEFVRTTLAIMRNGQALPLPHAGVLTMPTWLNRYPTTATNRNRHRAREVMLMFLATDILTFGTRPIDANAGANFEVPTRDNPQCNVCHKIIDPIAGDFQKWDYNDQDFWDPNRTWYTDMYAPGYGSQIMDTAQYTHAEQWLANQIASDERFPTAITNVLYRGLIGQTPLKYPLDPTNPDFASQQAAWHLQDELYSQFVKDFVASNFNLKTLAVDILMSPIYRTVNISSLTDPNSSRPVDPVTIQAVVNLGSYQLLTPELLNNKIEALTGITWGWNNDNPFLLNDYRLLYGGIDSVAVTTRLTAPNGLMANVALQMASDVACKAVAADFALPAGQRRLFPNVNVDAVPQTPDGATVPTHVTAIRQNIAYLHQYLLGESNPAEVDYTYNLFIANWAEGQKAVLNGTADNYLPWDCRAVNDPNGTPLPQASQIQRDDNYVVRAWIGVVTYLLSDYRFLFD